MTSIFEGDGRFVVQPTWRIPGTNPIKVSRAGARRLIHAFEHRGSSFHSGSGNLVWVILQHLAETKQAYQIKAYPNLGFEVSLLPPLPTT
jgi:hypothetical protein